ncbi:MAG TPA: TonB-dependent receptor [Thiobacillaceae bacterium]|nr:TonB-dependent receptor [Thiobacillaceae bacterium]
MRCIIAIALTLPFTLPAQGDEASLPLADEILVTATRFIESARELPVNSTVITRREIERSPETTLPEIIARHAGIGLRDLFGNNASDSTIDLRGFGAAAGQNVLVLVDGRTLNDIDLSGVMWPSIPLSAIERIEIIRGGASVLHGAGAVGGVINIITRSPLDRPKQAELGARAGSFDSNDWQVSGNLSGERAGLSLAANRYRSDGWRDNNETRQDSFYGNVRQELDLGEMSFKLGADAQNQRLPGARLVQPSIGLNELAADPKGTSTPLDWAGRDGWQGGLSALFRLPLGELVLDLDYRNKAQESYFDFGGFPDYRKIGLDMWTFSPRIRLPLESGNFKHEFVLGLDMGLWTYDLRTSNALANIAQPINRVQAEQRNAALYANDQLHLAEALSLSVGARLESFQLKAEDHFDPSAPGADFGSGAPAGRQNERQTAWELGLRYQLTSEHALYAKAGRSFRFATVDEIYEFSPSFTHAFQFLKPQTAQDAELGWETGAAKQGGRAALYYARVKDEIHLDPYSTGIGNTNLPPLRRYGLELEGRRKLGALEISATYTLAFAQFTGGVFNDVNLEGKQVPLVPRHKVALNTSWEMSGRTCLTGSVGYVGRQFMDNDEPNTLGVKIPDYTLLDAKLEHRLGNWKFSLSLNNLLDQKYYTYAVRSQFVPDRYAAYSLPGRHGWASAEYGFK